MNNKINYALGLALTTAAISGVNNFLTKIAVTAVNQPVVFTFIKNSLAAIFIIGLILILKKLPEIKKLSSSDIAKLLTIGIVGGSLPFILFFTGLKMIPAINAALIHKTLFIWVAFLAIPLLKEKIGGWQIGALMLLLGGNFVLFGLPKFTWGAGELMILAATLLWAIENIIAKIALRNLSSLLVAGARMAIGSLVILGVVIWQGNLSLISGISLTAWWWTILTSLLLTGYVITWYTALKYAPATLVASLLVPATLITNLLSAIFITHNFPSKEILSGLLLLAGAIILVATTRRTTNQLLEEKVATLNP